MRRKEQHLPIPRAFTWQGPGVHGDNILSGMLEDDDREEETKMAIWLEAIQNDEGEVFALWPCQYASREEAESARRQAARELRREPETLGPIYDDPEKAAWHIHLATSPTGPNRRP